MLNGIKTGFMLVVFMLITLLTSWIVSHAFNLMNSPSDFQVLIGVDLLLLLFMFWFLQIWMSIAVFRRWWRSRKNQVSPVFNLSGSSRLVLRFSSWASSFARITPGNVRHRGIRIPDINTNGHLDGKPSLG
jgi:hypothetical protein